MNIKSIVFNTVMGIVGICGVAASAYECHRANEACSKIDMGISEVLKRGNFDIPESVIDGAVRKAATDKVDKVVSNQEHWVHQESAKSIKSEVRRVVSEGRDDILKGIADRMHTEIAAINRDDLRTDIRKRLVDKCYSDLIKGMEGDKDDYDTYILYRRLMGKR